MSTPAPSQENLYLGAGELFFSRFDDDLVPTGFLHMGNVETFELTTADDRIQKFSSMKKSRPLYAERTRRRTVTLRVVADEWTVENVALGLMGEVVTYTQAATAVVDEVLVEAADPGVSNGVKLGGFYKTASYLLGTISMESDGGALTLGDDYEVYNARLGVIHILEDAPNVTPGDDLTISYTPTAITDWKRIRGGNKSKILGSVLFMPDDSEGVCHEVQVWNVSVTPDGAVGLISEDWAQFALTMTVQDDSDGLYGGSDDEPLYAVTEVPAAAA